MIDFSNYRIYTNKDGRIRAYNKKTHKVTSYPRLIMENILGRPLLPTEDVHHKDKNPLNNDPNNLEVLDHKEHDRMHSQKYFDKTMTCPICGKEFIWTASAQSTAFTNRTRPRYSNTGPFCSNRCKGINNQRIQAEKGLATKYVDRIEICAGCGKPFLYTAISQRNHRAENRNRPFCSIECVYKTNTKYIEEDIKRMQELLYANNGYFAKTERELGISHGHLRDILKSRGLPYHKADYMKTTA